MVVLKTSSLAVTGGSQIGLEAHQRCIPRNCHYLTCLVSLEDPMCKAIFIRVDSDLRPRSLFQGNVCSDNSRQLYNFVTAWDGGLTVGTNPKAKKEILGNEMFTGDWKALTYSRVYLEGRTHGRAVHILRKDLRTHSCLADPDALWKQVVLTRHGKIWVVSQSACALGQLPYFFWACLNFLIGLNPYMRGPACV